MDPPNDDDDSLASFSLNMNRSILCLITRSVNTDTCDTDCDTEIGGGGVSSPRGDMKSSIEEFFEDDDVDEIRGPIWLKRMLTKLSYCFCSLTCEDDVGDDADQGEELENI